MKDGENILGEFPLGAVIRVAENQDLPAVGLGKPLENLKSEAGKSIPVGNHNLEFIAAVKSLQ